MLRLVQVSFLFIFIYCLSVISGCVINKQRNKELYVFAAMSLTDAFTEIGTHFSEEHDLRVFLNFAASTTLQRQIEKGASADVFVSAGTIQVNTLKAQGLVDEKDIAHILSNQLVVVSGLNGKINIDNITELEDTSIRRIAIGHPEIVPAGSYAKEALKHYGLWEQLKPKFIFGNDVRATLAYLEAGNVDLAIVYETDTKVRHKVKVLYEFPEESHSEIVYPAAILNSSKQKKAAQEFVAFLKKPTTKEIFERYGFMSPTQKSVQESVTNTLE